MTKVLTFIKAMAFLTALVGSVVLGSYLVSASECEQPGYDYCWEGYNSYGDATAYARIFYSLRDDMGRHYGLGEMPGNYAVGGFFVDWGFMGSTNPYFYENLGSWDDLNCDENGCYPAGDFFEQLEYMGYYDLAFLHEQYNECPVLQAFDYDEAPNGDWAWTAPAYGWLGDGDCFGSGIRVVECYYDSDCGSGEVCDLSGDWQDWECITQLPCPDEVQWTPLRLTEVFGCNVWQLFEEYEHCEYDDCSIFTDFQEFSFCLLGGTYFYSPDYESISTLEISTIDYESLVPSECYEEEPECETNADCPAGYECINGECVLIEPECTTSADCDEGFECVSGECIGSKISVFFILVGVAVGVVVLILISRKLARKKRRK